MSQIWATVPGVPSRTARQDATTDPRHQSAYAAPLERPDDLQVMELGHHGEIPAGLRHVGLARNQVHVAHRATIQPCDQQNPATALLPVQTLREEVSLSERSDEGGKVGVGRRPDLHLRGWRPRLHGVIVNQPHHRRQTRRPTAMSDSEPDDSSQYLESLRQAYVYKVNAALEQGREDLAAELADDYLDEVRNALEVIAHPRG
jgi:hypothetical protein